MSHTSGGIDIEATLERVRGLPAEWYIIKPVPPRLARNLHNALSRPILTARQIDVLRLEADGKRAPQIAAELGISLHTVCQHTKDIRERMNVRNMTHAVASAIRQGIL